MLKSPRCLCFETKKQGGKFHGHDHAILTKILTRKTIVTVCKMMFNMSGLLNIC